MLGRSAIRGHGGIRGHRTVHVALAATLVGLCAAVGTPSAAASGPPPIDAGALPPNSKPSPPMPAEPATACASTQSTTSPATPAAQQFLGVENAWRFSRGAGQKVAVIDTGVAQHARLPGLEGGGDFVSPGDGTTDCDAHGTAVAGLIAGQPSGSDGFAGMAPDAQIMSIRQTSETYRYKGTQPNPDDPKNGGGVGRVDTLASAVRHAADEGATVINISEVACKAGSSLSDGALGAAVQYAAEQRDAVIVASSGNNDASDCKSGNPGIDPMNPAADLWDKINTTVTPAWYDQYVLSVGSVNLNGEASPFTVAGPWVGVAAPGEQIVSLDPNGNGLMNGTIGQNGPQQLAGTSFAAPYVSGLAALVRSRYPGLSAAEVIKRLEATAHPPAEGWNPSLGFGVIDPVAALTNEVDPAMALDKKPTTTAGTARQLPVPAAPPAPDNTARNIALIGTGVVAMLLVLGYLASFPIRRRLGVRED